MNKLRGIDNEFAEVFKKSELYTLYTEHPDELFLGVRDNYLNLYYNCDSIAKVEYKKREELISCKIDRYFLDGNHYSKNKLVNLTPCEICNSYKDIKEHSDDIVKAKKDKKEKKAQSKLVILNNQNKSSKWFCIDIEYANPKFRGRFDIIAISKKKSHKESAHKVALIELKYGHDAIGGKSGIYEHVNNFIEFRKEGYYNKQMKQEIVSIIKSLDNLGVEIPFTIPEESSISNNSDFYFITINNNAEKAGADTPKQTMAAYLFTDKRWDCKELSEKYNVQRDFKIDVTKKNNKFYATFLFSTQTLKDGITINDIIDGNYNERIIPE